MPFVPVANTAQINMCFRIFEQETQNVFHVRGPAPFDATSLAEACVAFQTWWVEDYANNSSTALSLVKIIARSLESQTAPAIEYTAALPDAGADTSEALPANAAAVIKWTTGIPGRSFRGRTYLMGLTVAMVEGNSLISSYVTALQTMGINLLDILNATDYELVVVSKWSYGNARTQGLVTPITSAFVDPFVDSQRRRLTGRGK